MEYKKTVTIVVPVFNAEDYLAECLNSLVNQTVSNYEIILVNDGSTDSSGVICDEYSEKNNSIKVVHKINQGVAQARKSGVDLAKGEYILFVDSDDLIKADTLQKLYKIIQPGDIDLVGFNSGTIVKGVTRTPENNPDYILEYNKKQFISNVIFDEIIIAEKASVVWNKLYRTEIIRKFINNYENTILEDYRFNIQYFEHVDKYVYTDEVFYYYRIVENSLSKKYNKNAYDTLKKVQIEKDTFITRMNMNSEKVVLYNYYWFINYTKNTIFTLFLSTKPQNLMRSFKTAKEILLSSQLLNYANLLRGTKFDSKFSKLLRLKMCNIILIGLYMKSKAYLMFVELRGEI